MPHRRRSSSSRRRRRWPALALAGVLAGCAPSASPPDSDTASAAAAAPTPSAEDLRRRALSDSAARLDSAFQHLRDSLGAESRALSSLDRRTPDYARRYDAFATAERRAIELRARRDTLRALAEGRAPKAEGRARQRGP